jgi:5-methyltetrahydropteroyltriglutamate--homocysteine methyltransferase
VQIDVDAWREKPEKAVTWGAEALDRALRGLPGPTAVHICYGWPSGSYKAYKEQKVDWSEYTVLLPLFRDLPNRLVALEFEAPKLDPALLELLPPGKDVAFGVIDIGDRVLETPEHIADRADQALQHIDPNRLWLAPDCGLSVTPRDLAWQKLAALAQGAALLRRRHGVS